MFGRRRLMDVGWSWICCGGFLGCGVYLVGFEGVT